MLKSLALVSLLLVTSIGVSLADKPSSPPGQNKSTIVYESLFVVPGNGEVFGSQGIVNEDGSYLIDIPGTEVDTNKQFAICIVSSGIESFLNFVQSDINGNLFREGGFTFDKITGIKTEFSFRIRENPQTFPSCSGLLRWLSGFELTS